MSKTPSTSLRRRGTVLVYAMAGMVVMGGFAALAVDWGRVQVSKTELQAAAGEVPVVEILLRNPGKLISQGQLLTEVWGPSYTRETHYLRQYMAQLRRKLEPDPTRPRHLLTEPGMGYRYQP